MIKDRLFKVRYTVTLCTCPVRELSVMRILMAVNALFVSDIKIYRQSSPGVAFYTLNPFMCTLKTVGITIVPVNIFLPTGL